MELESPIPFNHLPFRKRSRFNVVNKSVSTPLRIAVIPGDGTGPEVVAEGLKVLKAVAALEGFAYETANFDFGGERYLRTG